MEFVHIKEAILSMDTYIILYSIYVGSFRQ